MDPTESDHLSELSASCFIDKAIRGIKRGKAPGPSGITVEMLKIPGGVRCVVVTCISNLIV